VTDLTHAIALQTERGLEALSDKVETLEEKVEICDCDCGAEEYGELREDLETVREEVQTLHKRMQEMLRILIEHLEEADG